MRVRWAEAVSAIGVTLTIAVLTTSCGGDSSARSPTTTNTTASTTSIAPTSSTALSAEKQAVLDAYTAFWDDFRAAADPMNPASPRLSTHSTGRELDYLRHHFTTLSGEHTVIQGTIELAPHVTTLSADGATAVIEDCQDASKLLRYADKAHGGALRDSVDPRRTLARAQMLRDGEGWKVEFLQTIGTGCTPAA